MASTDKEVRGKDASVTLLSIIEANELAKPNLMSYNDWQKWRRDTYTRPINASGEKLTSQKFEAELWKQVMEHFYGREWVRDLAIQEAEKEPPGDDDEAPGAQVDPHGSTAPGGRQPSRDRAGSPSGVAALASDDRVPVSQDHPTTPRKSEKRKLPDSPQRVSSPGVLSNPSTFNSSRPENAASLKRKAIKDHDPSKMTFQEFEHRFVRILNALTIIGQPLDFEEEMAVRFKAEIYQELHDEGIQEDDEVRKYLKQRFAVMYTDVGEDAMTQDIQCSVLSDMLEVYEVDVDELRTRLTAGKATTPTPTKVKEESMPPVGSRVRRDPPSGAALFSKEAPVPGEETAPPGLAGGSSAGHPHQPVPRREAEEAEGAQVERLEARIRELEASRSSPGPGESSINDKLLTALQGSLDAQTAALEKMAPREREERTPGTIRVEPKVSWPSLGDHGLGNSGDETRKFFQSFEEIIGLANNGLGMNGKEKLIMLNNCLKDSKKTIFNNVEKVRRADKTWENDPESCYYEIRQKLMSFLETIEERRMRVDREWSNLYKYKHETCQAWFARWEEVHWGLDECGMSKTEREKFYGYAQKIEQGLAANFLKDRRLRPDPETGGECYRTPKTWEELHELLVEKERQDSSTRALLHHGSRSGGISGKVGGTQGKGKGKKGKGKDDRADSEKPCYNIMKEGKK